MSRLNIFGEFVEVPGFGHTEAMTANQQNALRVIREKAQLSADGFRAVCHAITKAGGMEWLPNQPVITKAQASLVIGWYESAGERARAVENRIIAAQAGQKELF